MIEFRPRPPDCPVAVGAIQWESSCDVVRVCCAVELLCVARLARSWGSGILAARGMAGAAGCRRMGSRKPEFGYVMVKLRIQPTRGFVATGTIGRVVPAPVIRVGGAFK